MTTRATVRLYRESQATLSGIVDSTTAATADAYLTLTNRLGSRLRRILREEAATIGEGGTLSYRQMADRERVESALRATQASLDRLTTRAEATLVSTTSGEVIPTAVNYDDWMIKSQLEPQYRTFGVRVNPSSLEAIASRTAERAGYLSTISTQTFAALNAALIEGVAIGRNPREAARLLWGQLDREFTGGLRRLERIFRTEMLDAYRNAHASVQNSNSDVVAGWVWYSAADERTCFPAGTLIRTRDGDVRIEDVADGTEVLTHAGRWRRVYHTMSRSYDGTMVTVHAGGMTVTSTATHPFLVSRDGALRWVPASDVRVGDGVVTDRIVNERSHRDSVVSVERSGNQPDDSVPGSDDLAVLRGVTLRHSGESVPVGFVYFNDNPQVGQIEVDRPSSSDNRRLLFVPESETFDGQTNVPFRDGFACGCPVAADRTEASLFRGNMAELLAARFADSDDWWTPTGFGAMRPSAAMTELLATNAYSQDGSAVTTASAVAVLDRSVNGESHAAVDTDLVDSLLRGDTSAGAVAAWMRWTGEESAAASFTGSFYARDGDLASGCVRVGLLVDAVAPSGAELPVAFADPSRGNVENDLAGLATPLHIIPVSQVDTHSNLLTVYNLEVEGDHSYIANGFAVHNCAGCWALHGEFFTNDIPGPDDHPNGRCARLPEVRRDLQFYDPPPSRDELWAALSPAQQQSVLGPTRYGLFESGAIGWGDLSTRVPAGEWRSFIVATPVRELVSSGR